MNIAEFIGLKKGDIIYNLNGSPLTIEDIDNAGLTVSVRDSHGVVHRELKSWIAANCIMHIEEALPVDKDIRDTGEEYLIEVEQATNGYILAERNPMRDNDLLVSFDDKKLKAQLADKLYEQLESFMNTTLSNKVGIFIRFVHMPSQYSKTIVQEKKQ